jgi:hypothetical protein
MNTLIDSNTSFSKVDEIFKFLVTSRNPRANSSAILEITYSEVE